MIALLARLALAQDADACNVSIDVAATIPENGADDVPLDVVPTLVFREDCGPGGPIWHAIIADAVGTTLYDDYINAEALVGEGMAAAALAMDAELLPDTDYTITLTADGGYYDPEPQVVAFRTGSTVFGGLQGEPAIEVSSADWYEDGGNLMMEVVVTGAPTDSAISALFVEGPAGAIDYVGALGPVDLSLVAVVADPPEEACATVYQLDARAEVHSAETCMPVTVIPRPEFLPQPERCGCQPEAGVADTGGLLLGLIGVFVGRRRRS